MSTKVKVIKSKSFEAQGAKHTHYTVAYRGRLFGVNTLAFAEEGDDALKLSEDGNVLTVAVDCELKKDTIADQLTGEVRSFIGIVPKLDLAVSDI